MTRLVFDFDPILYCAGSLGEERSIKAVHRESGDEYEFPTRTAFWGHHKKKAGGWLAEYNAGRTTPRLPDDFDVTDIQHPGPIEHCMRTMKQMIVGIKEAVGAKYYYGYTGKGTSFREDISTVIQYKGNRIGSLRPVHLDALKDYLVSQHAAKIIEGIEADDACSIDSYDAWKRWTKTGSDDDKLVLAAVDKDYLGCACHLYNTDKADGIDSYGPTKTDSGFGRLYIDTSTKSPTVKGRGRLWLYQQVMNGDATDNYFANSATEMKWAEMSAYNLLKDCKDDKEAFEALVRGYKTLYPAPKHIYGWRGDVIQVDWCYMLQENFSLAHMLRWEGDKVDVKETMDKLGVTY